MSNSIRSIVESAVPTEYREQAQPIIEQVVAALNEALSHSLTALAASAESAGVSQSQFTEACVQAGLVERAPEPVSETASEAPTDGLSEAVARLEATVNRILRAAEARGLRI